jgi:hypothetical protein
MDQVDAPAAAGPGAADAPARPVRRSRRRRRVIIAAVVVVVGVWVALAGWQLLEARRHAQAGIDRLRETRELMGPARLIRGEGRPQLEAAHRELEQAAEAADSPLLQPFLPLPVVGRQVRSVQDLSASAERVVGIGIDAMARTSAEAAKPTEAGPQRIERMRALGAIAAEASAELRDVDLGPDDGLVGPLREARDDFAADLTEVRDAMRDLDVASQGLSQFAEGPSRYLVLAANNSEMRAGSGMLLSAGVLDMQSGRFDLGDMTDTGLLLLPPGAVEMAPGDFRDRWSWLTPNEEWRYLMMSPDFPASAELAARMWQARTGETVDGVIALDPIALRALVRASGPVQVDGKTIDASNVINELLLQQYLDFHGGDTGPDQQAMSNEERREYSSQVARAIIDQLDVVGWDLPELANDLSAAAEGRHILAWSSKPEQQRAWQAVGVAGRLQRDSVLVGLSNRSGNKLDQFLKLHADVTHRSVDDGTEVTLRIRVENRTPAEGLNDFIAGPYPYSDFVRGEYRGILSVDVPGYSRDIRLDGTQKLVASGKEGPNRMVAGDVRVLPGETGEYTARFVVPGGYDTLRIEPSARYPTITWTAGDRTWEDDRAQDLTL